jgi:hypothetical protein
VEAGHAAQVAPCLLAGDLEVGEAEPVRTGSSSDRRPSSASRSASAAVIILPTLAYATGVCGVIGRSSSMSGY